MIKRVCIWLVLVFAAAFLLYGIESLALQRQLAEKTIRLHVIANSDQEEDQELKLLVRDAVLREAQLLTEGCGSALEAGACLREALPRLHQAAEQVICQQGKNDAVRVSLEVESFDTRYYDSFTLPAGDYPALCVRIGAAEGKNWWCVVFPSLCTAAGAEEFNLAAQAGGYTGAEQALVSEGEQGYVLRFRTLEWIRKLTELFS